MADVSLARSPKPTLNILALAGALVGGLLFAYTLRRAGVSEVLAGIRHVGVAFVAVLLLSGFRMVVRAKAWSLCVGGAERLGLREALSAFVAGDALGNITPLGPVASEGAKAVLARRSLSSASAFASVVLENIFYSISVAVMVTAGSLAFIAGFRMTDAVLSVSIAISVLALLAIVAVWVFLKTRPAIASRLVAHSNVRLAEDRVFGFAAQHPDRLATILALEFTFHAAAVAEIVLLLWVLVGASPRMLLLALVLETVERVITIAFKFVPFRLGVDQAGSGLVASLVGLTTATGVTIATIRTARNLFWAAIGLVLLATTQGKPRKRE